MNLDADQILSVAYPEDGELRYGFEHGVVNGETVMDVLIRERERGVPLTREEEAIAFLLRDELDRLHELIPLLPDASTLPGGMFPNAGMRFWLYVLLSRALVECQSPHQFWSRVDDIHAIFGYAGSMTPLIRMPSDPVPEEDSRANLESYILSEAQYYSGRMAAAD